MILHTKVLRGDDGIATVFSCIVLAAIVAATGGLLHVGSAVTARHTAQSSADLSALAGAGALEGGSDAACAKATELALRMRTVLAECVVEDWDVIILVRAPVLLSRFGIGDAEAAARAGPAE